jgi:hypothetical protein
VRVVLHRLGERAVDLLEGALVRVRDLGERAGERVDEERVRVLA